MFSFLVAVTLRRRSPIRHFQIPIVFDGVVSFASVSEILLWANSFKTLLTFGLGSSSLESCRFELIFVRFSDLGIIRRFLVLEVG